MERDPKEVRLPRQLKSISEYQGLAEVLAETPTGQAILAGTSSTYEPETFQTDLEDVLDKLDFDYAFFDVVGKCAKSIPMDDPRANLNHAIEDTCDYLVRLYTWKSD